MLPGFGLDEWMVAWNPIDKDWPRGKPRGSVEVGIWPDKVRWNMQYQKTAGCCCADWHLLSETQKLQQIANGVFYLVMGCGLSATAVHREFLKIDAYRTMELDCLGMVQVRMFRMFSEDQMTASDYK